VKRTSVVTGPTARHRALAHASRVQLFEVLQDAPEGLGVTELARQSGLHPNTVRVHLDQLTEVGLVTGETIRSGGRGRPSIRYRANEPPDDDRYRLLSSMLATAITDGDRDGPSPAAEAAGRHWGQRLAAASPRTDATSDPRRSAPEAVTALFDQLGFAPAGDDDRLVLHDCPYRELAEQHPDVICGLHLGMLRGVLDAHGAPGDDAWLDPFVTPTRCLAGLTATSAAGPESEVHP
jgi:predicted ArsR family transcriptional regulator